MNERVSGTTIKERIEFDDSEGDEQLFDHVPDSRKEQTEKSEHYEVPIGKSTYR